MSERDLSDLLERAGERVAVGPAPISRMVTGAARQRRRRLLGVTAASIVAVVATVGGAALLTTPGGADSSQPAVTSPGIASPSVPTDEGRRVIPAGTRLVGLGSAAIAVPKEWETNRLQCGTPLKDTVVIDTAVIETCLRSRPEGVESISVGQSTQPMEFGEGERFEIDGVPAERRKTTCRPAGFGGGTVCQGTVSIPSLGVSFTADSSTSASEVDRILEWIHVVPDQVGVPGYASIALRAQGGAQVKYLEALEEAGLEAEVRTEKVPGIVPGYVLDVSPSPGTMVEPGDVVTVTVVGPPDGPADEVRVGVNSVDANDQYRDLSDEQIRAGATIRLSVGDRIWAYADGKRASTLAGRLDGTSLKVDDWTAGPNYPHSWEAVSPGTTTITLTITADGEPVTMGTVTVVVG